MNSDTSQFSGFWRRFGAFTIDSVVLGLVGTAFGLLLVDSFVKLGVWGRLLGFAVALMYFGLLNSRLGSGQTIGKRVLGIKVVNSLGDTLSLKSSVARFVVIGIPYFLNNAAFPDSVVNSSWVYVLSIAVFGLGLSALYLLILNRPSRQSLHDLVVGSFVVRVAVRSPIAACRPWRGHLAACTLLVIGAAALPAFMLTLTKASPFKELSVTQRSVTMLPWVISSRVSQGRSSTSSHNEKQETTFLSVMVTMRDPQIADAARAESVAEAVFEANPAAQAVDIVNVTLAYGYDIGIASAWRKQAHVHSPSEWREASALRSNNALHPTQPASGGLGG